MNKKIEGIAKTLNTSAKSQQKAAKIAGSMFLFLIVLYFANQFITFQISSAPFKRITELSIDIIYLSSTLLLIFALYQTLKPVNKKLAQVAMFWRFGEAFIILIMMIFNFEGKAQSIGFNVSSILFSIGSLIFYYLFFKSRYIPRNLSVVGIFASAIIMIVGFGILIFPSHSRLIQFGWIPMIIIEIATGGWLLFKGLRIKMLIQPNLKNH